MSDVKDLSHELVKAEDIIGVAVKNTGKEDLGQIEDVVLDKQTGNVCYVVLSFGGIFGLGEKLFALPWRSLTYNMQNACFTLNVSKDKLENAPGFDKNNWPNMADRAWGEKIYNYYGERPFWNDRI